MKTMAPPPGDLMESLVFAGITALLIFIALFAIGVLLSRLYRRASKETAFVKTGLGGANVIMDGGALVLPVFHGVVDVSLKTHKLVVKRTQQQALITKTSCAPMSRWSSTSREEGFGERAGGSADARHPHPTTPMR